MPCLSPGKTRSAGIAGLPRKTRTQGNLWARQVFGHPSGLLPALPPPARSLLLGRLLRAPSPASSAVFTAFGISPASLEGSAGTVIRGFQRRGQSQPEPGAAGRVAAALSPPGTREAALISASPWRLEAYLLVTEHQREMKPSSDENHVLL